MPFSFLAPDTMKFCRYGIVPLSSREILKRENGKVKRKGAKRSGYNHFSMVANSVSMFLRLRPQSRPMTGW